MVQNRIRIFIVCCLFVFMGAKATASESVKSKALFAIVDGYEITEAVFLTTVRSEGARRYYHGRITEERVEEVKKDVARTLIDSVLLMHEAERQGLSVDADKIMKEIARFEKRNEESLEWQRDREQILPSLRMKLESRERVALLEKTVRAKVVLTEELKRAFYENNPDLFVSPEKRQVSLILIKVQPSATFEEWNSAHEQLGSLRERILLGESFSSLAKEFSDDRTASKGGDMGYQHKGMLHNDVEEVLDALAVGEVSEPIRLLQGVVLVRLDGVIPSSKLKYEDVLPQITQQLTQKMSDELWDGFLSRLRDNAYIVRF